MLHCMPRSCSHVARAVKRLRWHTQTSLVSLSHDVCFTAVTTLQFGLDPPEEIRQLLVQLGPNHPRNQAIWNGRV